MASSPFPRVAQLEYKPNVFSFNAKQDGKIIERGTHAELMKAKGAYFGLFTRQFEEMALNRAAEDNNIL